MENTDLINKDNEQVNAQKLDHMHSEYEKCECPNKLKSDLEKVSHSLLNLKKEVEFKSNAVLEKIAVIKDKATKFINTYKLKLDHTEYETAEKSVNEYAKILAAISKELDAEFGINSKLLQETENQSQKTDLPTDETNSLNLQIAGRINWTRKFIKRLNKDLSISYSRYSFELEHQERYLEILEVRLKHYTSNK